MTQKRDSAKGRGGYPTGVVGAKSVACPTCGARPTNRCTTLPLGSTRYLRGSHKARIAAFREGLGPTTP